jgi:amidophosphoribosyltransferase
MIQGFWPPLSRKGISIDADVVIGVPDSGLVAAKGYAMESASPSTKDLSKTVTWADVHQTRPGSREQAVKLKLNPLRATVAGKRVVMIDDSIVRGTTSKKNH